VLQKPGFEHGPKAQRPSVASLAAGMCATLAQRLTELDCNYRRKIHAGPLHMDCIIVITGVSKSAG
jgi:hypothetical protein